MAGGNCLKLSWKLCVARVICFKLFRHWVLAAASRTFWTAGTSRPIRMAMMAITTSSSISVNAGLVRGRSFISDSQLRAGPVHGGQSLRDRRAGKLLVGHRHDAEGGEHVALAARALLLVRHDRRRH